MKALSREHMMPIKLWYSYSAMVTVAAIFTFGAVFSLTASHRETLRLSLHLRQRESSLPISFRLRR